MELLVVETAEREADRVLAGAIAGGLVMELELRGGLGWVEGLFVCVCG